MAPSHVLVVDDDDDIRLLVSGILTRAGHRVSEAPDGQTALRMLFDLRPQLVILDVSMPGADGWDVLERVRELSEIPVLMLTASGGELEKVRALRGGADDYLTKPFGRQELAARVDALLRRARQGGAEGPDVEGYSDGPLRVDFRGRVACVGDDEVSLTPQEYRLLVAFARNPGQVLSAEQLLALAWDDELGDGSDRVKVYIGYLRAKLAAAGLDDAIETLRGFGYRLRRPLGS